MKKILFLLIIMITLSSLAYSQPGRRGRVVARPAAGRPIEKHRARVFIRRTTLVILEAQRQVKANKVYTGNLARAVAHQRYARRLYFLGRYRAAIHHSRRARMLAFVSIRANKGTVKSEWELNQDETQDSADSPSDQELDQTLNKEMPNEPTKDEDVVEKDLGDIDVGENE